MRHSPAPETRSTLTSSSAYSKNCSWCAMFSFSKQGTAVSNCYGSLAIRCIWSYALSPPARASDLCSEPLRLTGMGEHTWAGVDYPLARALSFQRCPYCLYHHHFTLSYSTGYTTDYTLYAYHSLRCSLQCSSVCSHSAQQNVEHKTGQHRLFASFSEAAQPS